MRPRAAVCALLAVLWLLLLVRALVVAGLSADGITEAARRRVPEVPAALLLPSPRKVRWNCGGRFMQSRGTFFQAPPVVCHTRVQSILCTRVYRESAIHRCRVYAPVYIGNRPYTGAEYTMHLYMGDRCPALIDSYATCSVYVCT